MKKYIQDFLLGFVFGIFIIIIPPILSGGEFGLMGGGFIIDWLNIDSDWLEIVIGGLIYFILVSIIPFFIYSLTKWYKFKHSKGFSVKIISFLFFITGSIIVLLIALSIFFYYFYKNLNIGL